MSTSERRPAAETRETTEHTPTERDEADQREQIAAIRRAAALRQATARAFDTRTERWQEAGLSEQIDHKESRKAGREAIVLLLLLIGVLYLFANRNTFPLLEDVNNK